MNIQKFPVEMWRTLRRGTSRQIFLYSLAPAALIWAAMLFLLDGGLMASATAVGMWIGIMLVALLFAALGAIPGWLIRGSYDMRPLLIMWIGMLFLVIFCNEILMPMGHGLSGGVVFKIIAFAIVASANFFITLCGLMTTFPHRWSRGLFIASCVWSFLTVFGTFKMFVTSPREEYLKTVFEKRESNLVPLVGGRAVSSAQIGYELRVFDSKTRK